ncbi:MAG: immunoglobulin domain-containing protein, partial [Verrucomicrobiota bacterium]
MNPLTALRTQISNTSGLLRGALLLATLVCRLSAATYYVDYSSGSDTNTGTSTATAWKHCPGDSAATGAASMMSLVPGDTVSFKGGVSYVLTGATGIALRWNGASGSLIVYDGNSANTWGSGRATFTDNRGASSITAFSAANAVSHLTFKNLEFAGIGGAAALPADAGSASAPRFGGGLAFSAGASETTIASCVFRDLGYAFNQKPMSAASLNGVAVVLRGTSSTVTIDGCTFSRLSTGIAMTGASSLSGVKIANCAFTDSVVWPLDLPANLSSGVSIYGCAESNNAQFARSAWTGYGESPRVTSRAATAGASVSFTATAAALPSATFQWYKDAQAISGATNSTLTLSSVSADNTGVYTASATNSAGSTLSHETVLTVTGNSSGSNAAPAITTQPASQTVATNSTVTLTVAASGSPAPTIQWLRNGSTFNGWTGTTLSLPGFSSNDVGAYTAVATNASGSATSAAAVISLGSPSTPNTPNTPTTPTAPTNVAPAITTQPASQ